MPWLVPAALEAIVAFLLLSGAACFAMMVKGALAMRRLIRQAPRADGATLLKSRLVPAVSVIVAPSDSGGEARAMVRRLVGLHFGNHEVVLVLNSPRSADWNAWTEDFRLAASMRRVSGTLPMGRVRSVFQSLDPIPLFVIVIERSSYGLALNAAVNAAQFPVIGLFGPECEFPPEALLRLIPPMLEDPTRMIAVCGVEPGLTGAGTISQFAALDFLRGWLGRQAAFSNWHLWMPSPGSGMLLLRDAILRVNGFGSGPFELFLRLHREARASKRGDRIAFAPHSGCRQRVARSLAELRRGMRRDQRDAGRAIGTGGLPWWVRFGLLPLGFVHPLCETIAYILTLAGLAKGWVPLPLALLALIATVCQDMLLSMAAVSLRDFAENQGSDPTELSRLFFAAIPENLGFRQVRNFWLLSPWLDGAHKPAATWTEAQASRGEKAG